MKHILQMKNLVWVLVTALMSTFSFGINLYHQQTGNFYSLVTQDTTFISAVQDAIAQELNTNPAQIHLTYKGMDLNSVYELSYYQIASDDTIFVDYQEAEGDITFFNLQNESFNAGFVYDSLVGNEDGSGTLYTQFTFFSTGNKKDTLGVVQIIETTPQVRLSSSVFLQISDGSDWTYDAKEGTYSFLKGTPLTKEQRMALLNENRTFELEILDSKNNRLTATNEPMKSEEHLFSLHDKLIDGNIKISEMENEDGSVEVSMMFMVKATEEVTNLLGAAHIILGEDITDGAITGDENDILVTILDGSKWTYNSSTNMYEASTIVTLSENEYNVIDNFKTHIVIVNANDEILLTTDDEDFLHLQSIFADIKGGLGHVSNVVENQDGSASFDFTIMVNTNVLFGNDLNMVKLYADEDMGTYKDGDLFLNVSDGTNWTLNTAKNMYEMTTNISLTKEEYQLLFVEDHEFVLNVYSKTDNKKVLLSTEEPSMVYVLKSDEHVIDFSFAKTSIKIASDGSSELMVDFLIDSEEDLLDELGMAHIHTLFGLGQIGKDGVFKGLVMADDWSVQGATGFYVASKKIMLSAQETMALLNPENVFYINIHSKSTNAAIISSKEMDMLELFATEKFTTNFDAKESHVNATIYMKNDMVHMLFDFAIKANGDASALLGASHIHTENAIGNISAGGVFVGLLNGTEWKMENGMYVAQVDIMLTKEQADAFDDDNNDFYINIHQKGTGAVMLTTKAPITSSITLEETTSKIGTSAGTLHIITNDNATVIVADLLGRTVISTTVNGTTAINTNGLQGAYVVVVETATETIREKIILE